MPVIKSPQLEPSLGSEWTVPHQFFVWPPSKPSSATSSSQTSDCVHDKVKKNCWLPGEDNTSMPAPWGCDGPFADSNLWSWLQPVFHNVHPGPWWTRTELKLSHNSVSSVMPCGCAEDHKKLPVGLGLRSQSWLRFICGQSQKTLCFQTQREGSDQESLWNMRQHIKWNDQQREECSLAWVKNHLRKWFFHWGNHLPEWFLGFPEWILDCSQDQLVISLDMPCQSWEVFSGLFTVPQICSHKRACERLLLQSVWRVKERCKWLLSGLWKRWSSPSVECDCCLCKEFHDWKAFRRGCCGHLGVLTMTPGCKCREQSAVNSETSGLCWTPQHPLPQALQSLASRPVALNLGSAVQTKGNATCFACVLSQTTA